MRREYDALKRSGVAAATMSGIGKVNAAAAATEMILRDRPDCIVNSGCAGSLKADVRVMDVVIGAQCAYQDVWCGEPNLPGQVEGEPQRFDADPGLLAAAKSLRPGTGRLHSGLICTGDQFFISSALPRTGAYFRSIRTDSQAIWSRPPSRRYAGATECLS